VADIDDELLADDQPVPAVAASPPRLTHVVHELVGREALVRPAGGPLVRGQLASVGEDWKILVGGTAVTVPASAELRVALEGEMPGIEISSAFDPPPDGFWLWLPCDAVRHAKSLLREASDLSP